RIPQLSELIVPDGCLLFSWGLLKVADVFPQFTLGEGTPLKAVFNAAFWGDLLSGIPIIALLVLPFLDRGRESRPAKAPSRSAVDVALFIVFAPMVVTTFALMRRPESIARKVSTWAGALGLIGFLAFYFALPVVTKPVALGWVLSVLWPNMNTLVFFPIFGILTAW